MFTVSAEELKQAVAIVSKSVARDDSRPVLAGVSLVAGPGRFELAAADGFLLTRVTLDVSTDVSSDVRAVLNAKELAKFTQPLTGKLARHRVSVEPVGNVWTFRLFCAGVAEPDVHVRTIDGTFPDYNQIIPRDDDLPTIAVIDGTHGQNGCDVKHWLLAIEPVKPVDRKRNTAPAIVNLFLRNTDPALTASNTGFASYTRRPAVDVTGPDNQISFNAQYLRDILATVPKGESVTLRVKSRNCAARFDVGAHITHVLMPIVTSNNGEHSSAPAAPEPDQDLDDPLHVENQSAHVVLDTIEDAPRYTAVAALSCSGCGSHEINRTSATTGTCAECDAAAELDPFVVYGPSLRDYEIECRHAERQARDTARVTWQDNGMPAGAVNILDIIPPTTPTTPTYCAECGTPHEPADKFCGECGHCLGQDAKRARVIQASREVRIDKTGAIVHETSSAAAPDEHWTGYVPIRVKYHGKNPARIYDACPRATDVRGFHDWLKVGRCVTKGQHGIMIMAPVGGARGDDAMHEDSDGVIDDYRRPRVKKTYVFDISQTQVIQPKEQPTTMHAMAAD